MNRIKKLDVFYNGKKVGTLAELANNMIAFEYDEDWLLHGFSISPLSLPLEKRVFIPKKVLFDGLFGVFDDSLPDGWGRLLVDRLLLKHHINPNELSQLDRLAIVGNSGMGALEYIPQFQLQNENIKAFDLDQIANECSEILNTNYSNNIDALFSLGGSSGGARPKILTEIDHQDWIIKFPSSQDSKDIGLEEYRYSLCAKRCGIEMSNTKLFASNQCQGYFGVERFDRIFHHETKTKVHMISVAGLLETTHRIPNLDYDILMKVTLKITDSYDEVMKLFRLMCFNVYAHNRDDHSKNFSFIFNPFENKWKLSPAYDLTYSNSYYGEHATFVHGNGKNPGMKELLAVAKNIGLPIEECKKIVEEIQTIVNEDLHDILEKNK